MIYALLPNKKAETYLKFFELLKLHITNDPQSFLIDYEKAVIKPFKHVFGDDVDISGCYFHLSQNIMKHLKSKPDYLAIIQNIILYKFVEYLKFLAFVPKDKVVAAFDRLSLELSKLEFKESKTLKEIYDYFESNYIGKQQINGNLRKVPLFEINMWNCYERFTRNMPRTTNNVESWHKQFAVNIFFVIIEIYFD